MSFKNLRPRTGSTYWVICLILISLAGCSTPMPTSEPITITFAYPEVDADYYAEGAKRFHEQYPDITVELLPTGWNELTNPVTEDIDVFVTRPFAVLGLLEQGDILSLDPFVEQDRSLDLSDYYAGAVDLLTVENKMWAVPYGVDPVVMFYNRDLFDQHNVPYPEIGWTWEDFLNAGLSITDPDARIYGYTTIGSTTDPTYPDAAFFVYQHGGRLFDSLQNPTRTTFNDPLTIEAVEWYARLYQEYDVAPTPQEARRAFGGGQYAIYDGLRHGNVGMWNGMFSERGGVTWPVEWFVNWGIAPLPQDVGFITQADVEGYAIRAQTPYPDACWKWIVSLSQQTLANVRQPHRLMPARRSVAESTAYGQLVGVDIAAVLRTSMENAVMINQVAFAEFEDAMDVFGEAVGAVVDGNLTPQEALEQAQQRVEESSQ
jgi:ABC-type glycerol-3-phosphate transport system substrate-binding protein